MKTSGSTAPAVAALLASGLFWGLTWLPLKYFAERGLSGLALTLVAYGSVGLVGLPLLWLQRAALRPQAGLLALVCLLGGTANVCFVNALVYGEVVRAMLLFYLAPMWSVLGGRAFLGERISASRVFTVCLSLVGAALVLGRDADLSAALRPLDLLALASGFLYAMQNVCSRKADSVPTGAKAVAVFFGGGVLAAVLMPAMGHTLPAMPPALILQVAGFAVWMAIAMWTTMYGVTHLEAGRSGVLLVAELLVAAVSAMLIAGERLEGLEWLGAALILCAAVAEARGSATPSTRTADA
jgi:drug/metabolite transporter (DMT)-like permease